MYKLYSLSAGRGKLVFLTVKCRNNFMLAQVWINQPSDILAYLITVRRCFQLLQIITACIMTSARKWCYWGCAESCAVRFSALKASPLCTLALKLLKKLLKPTKRNQTEVTNITNKFRMVYSTWRFLCNNIHLQKWRLQNMTRFKKTKTKERAGFKSRINSVSLILHCKSHWTLLGSRNGPNWCCDR